jgi:hypothetical protein
MAKRRKPASAHSNAARQTAYRQRHRSDIDGQAERLDMVVTVQAKAKLERLARHYGVTQRELFIHVLTEVERLAVDSLNSKDANTFSTSREP